MIIVFALFHDDDGPSTSQSVVVTNTTRPITKTVVSLVKAMPMVSLINQYPNQYHPNQYHPNQYPKVLTSMDLIE